MLTDCFVHHDNGCPGSDRLPHRGQHVDGSGHVVDALEGEGRVEGTEVRHVVTVGIVEPHPVRDSGGDRVRASCLDRRLIDVEALHRQLWVCAGEGDRGPPRPGADIGNARARRESTDWSPSMPDNASGS